MADEGTPAATQSSSKPSLPVKPPPFIAFPFQQVVPPFWQVQDQQSQLYGIKTLSPGVQLARPDLHAHSQRLVPLMQTGDGRGDAVVRPSSAVSTQFATHNLPPHPGDRQPHGAYSSVSSLSSQNAAAGLQLCTESPESSLLDPQTSSPPSLTFRQAAEKEILRLNVKLQTEKENSGAVLETPAVGPSQNTQPSVYPPPSASQQDVVADKHLFLETLSKLHAFLGIHARVPKRGGRELDLHMLYCEVTAQGGVTQVMKFKKWKAVILALNLPPQVSSPSLFLQKHYISLLHHYEQVYYFRVQGQLVPPPDTIEPARKRRKSFKTVETCGDGPDNSIGRYVTGSIEGKFEHGYLVTVVVGTEKMRGVLYHVPHENETPQFAALPELMNKLNSPQPPSDFQVGLRRRKSKTGDYTKRDPNAPRSSRSGYNFFFADQQSKLKDCHAEKHTDVTKIIGERWQRLTPEERMPYLQRGHNDKERYRNEKTEYQQKLKMQIEIRDENAVKANSESLEHFGHVPNPLGQDGIHEFRDANNSDQDYHVSLDPDLDIGACDLAQDQSLRTETGDHVHEARIDYSQQRCPVFDAREQGQEQRVYAAQPEDEEIQDEDDEEDEDEDEEEDDDEYSAGVWNEQLTHEEVHGL